MPVQSKPDRALSDPLTWRSMTALVKVGAVIIWAVFTLYLLFLLKLLLFSRAPGSDHSLNLIPFGTIWNYLSGDAGVPRGIAISNLVGNVAAFIPLGVFLPLLRRSTGIWSNLLIVLCASVGVEIVQGIVGVGASDIDDVILNTLGGLIGILFFAALLRLLRRWSRVTIAIAVLSLLLAPVLGLLVFGVRLRM